MVYVFLGTVHLSIVDYIVSRKTCRCRKHSSDAANWRIELILVKLLGSIKFRMYTRDNRLLVGF